MLTRETTEGAYRVVRYVADDGSEVLRAQCQADGGNAMVCFAVCVLPSDVTEAEAVAIADSFAPTVAVLLSEMRLALRVLRGGK
jgi:hypothetical protein